ncbi:MAG: hypothetical protein L7S64_11200 [Longimicrobiales bacterium]|jgi:hypothetical protein|nr:hypothetical protein [Longimicrobiales bacterium]
MKLTLEELAIAEAARAELLETPLPPAMGQVGCLAAIAGVLVLVVWPPVVEALPLLSFFTPFMMLFAVLGVVGGPVFLMFGGQSGRNAARAAIEASLRVFEDANADRDELLRAAAVLLERAYISQGPSTELIMDVAEARDRVGAGLGLVLEVERHFSQRFGSWPVFDSSEDADE